jgi:hypothetical protein
MLQRIVRGDKPPNAVQPQMLQGLLCQRQMPPMRGIKRPPEQANSDNACGFQNAGKVHNEQKRQTTPPNLPLFGGENKEGENKEG